MPRQGGLRLPPLVLEEYEVMLLAFLAGLLFLWGFLGLGTAVNIFDERPPGSTPPWPVALVLVWPLWPFWLAMALSVENGRWLGTGGELGVVGVAGVCALVNVLLIGPALIVCIRRLTNG